jgi:hypothetical protein
MTAMTAVRRACYESAGGGEWRRSHSQSLRGRGRGGRCSSSRRVESEVSNVDSAACLCGISACDCASRATHALHRYCFSISHTAWQRIEGYGLCVQLGSRS